MITIHDLVREKFPDYYHNNSAFIEQRRLLIQAADHIIAVSHNTKDDIIDYYGFALAKFLINTGAYFI